MIEVAPNLYVGSADDFELNLNRLMENDTWAMWSVVHAAKEPYHRQCLGYQPGKAAPKDSSEYLFALRGDRLFLNMIDVKDPAFIHPTMVDAAIAFMERADAMKRKVLVHCNQGKSRAPVLMMLLLAPMLDKEFDVAEAQFHELYPPYEPADGVRIYARTHWAKYHNRPFGRAREEAQATGASSDA